MFFRTRFFRKSFVTISVAIALTALVPEGAVLAKKKGADATNTEPESRRVERVVRSPIASPPVPSDHKSHSFRILSFNTALFSPIFQCGGPDPYDLGATPTPIIPNCFLLNPLGENIAQRANLIADLISPGYFDLVALNEVWDEDDGKDVLEDRLKGKYNHYVKYVDTLGGVATEDSGLMIFSKFDFEPLPDSVFRSEDNQGSGGDDSDRIAFMEYNDSSGFDSMAAKGAAMVRVKHPSSGRMLNLVATHMQADRDQAVIRAKQLHQIYGSCHLEGTLPLDWLSEPDLVHKTLSSSLAVDETLCNWTNNQWLMITGDLNVYGEGGVGDAVYPSTAVSPTTELGAYLEPGEWRHRFGDPAQSGTGFALYDAWAETTSEKDLGLTHPEFERLDYALVTRRTNDTAAGITAGRRPDLCVQHTWIPPEFEGLSDHRPIATDLNLEANQCNPRLARVITDLEMGKADLVDGPEAQRLPAAITYPGSMQWWRLEESGTYAIALDPEAKKNGVRIEIYREDNLSRPLKGAYELGKDTIEVCDYIGGPKSTNVARCKEIEADKYVLPKGPFYMRVFSKNRDWSGNFWLAVYKYSCKSKQEACDLLPHQPVDFSFPPAGELLNDEDEAWFSLKINNQADSGELQDLSFYAENAVNGYWDAPNIRIFGSNGATQLSEINGETIFAQEPGTAESGRQIVSRKTKTKTNKALFMRVRRTNLDAPLRMLAGWHTNLVFLGGDQVGSRRAKLVCEDETNPEMGHDEILLQANIDGAGWETRGHGLFDCNAKDHPRFWDSKLNTIRYLDSVEFRLMELDDGNPDNPSPVVAVDAWPTQTHKSPPEVRHHIRFKWEGGEYVFHFNTSKWRVQ